MLRKIIFAGILSAVMYSVSSAVTPDPTGWVTAYSENVTHSFSGGKMSKAVFHTASVGYEPIVYKGSITINPGTYGINVTINSTKSKDDLDAMYNALYQAFMYKWIIKGGNWLDPSNPSWPWGLGRGPEFTTSAKPVNLQIVPH